MTSRNQKLMLALALIGALSVTQAFADKHPASDKNEMRFIQVTASTREQRSAIADLGVSIEATRTDSVWGFANKDEIRSLKEKGFKVIGDFDLNVARGGHESSFGFPRGDERFHTYAELTDELKKLQTQAPDLIRVRSIGKTIENRDIWAVHINTSSDALRDGTSNKPGAIFMGNHHAREHVSLEIPLMLLQYLVAHRTDTAISQLLDSRDIWIIPSVNPDGAEHDVSSNRYKLWRKNRRNNGDGTYGVDLNRNYAYGWGTGGSSTNPSSDIYMGESAFSEPETQAIRDFVNSHLNAKILLSFHTFSELILYPWGGKYDPVPNARDQAVFETMARTMAKWNKYKPEQSSDLYIASGDTTDWAYGTHGIFAFTFELSPADMISGGFYPGAGILDRVFTANLQPCLYMIDLADNPYRSLPNEPTGFLKNYVEPKAPSFWQ